MTEEIIDLDNIFQSKAFLLCIGLLIGIGCTIIFYPKEVVSLSDEEYSNLVFDELINTHELYVGSYHINENMTLLDIRHIYEANKAHPIKRKLVYETYKRFCSGV